MDQGQSGSSTIDLQILLSFKILPPSVNTDPILTAQDGSAETQSAVPKTLLVVLPKKQIILSRLSPDQKASEVLEYIQYK